MINNDVGRCSAWETNAVINIIPARVWIHNPSHCLIMNINELGAVESLGWYEI